MGVNLSEDCGISGEVRLKNKSIPNVSTPRLHRRLGVLHDMFHTVPGLHVFDGPRREMINQGMKMVLIRDELMSRGSPVANGCRFCEGFQMKGQDDVG